jgi:hypothetical protein
MRKLPGSYRARMRSSVASSILRTHRSERRKVSASLPRNHHQGIAETGRNATAECNQITADSNARRAAQGSLSRCVIAEAVHQSTDPHGNERGEDCGDRDWKKDQHEQYGFGPTVGV